MCTQRRDDGMAVRSGAPGGAKQGRAPRSLARALQARRRKPLCMADPDPLVWAEQRCIHCVFQSGVLRALSKAMILSEKLGVYLVGDTASASANRFNPVCCPEGDLRPLLVWLFGALNALSIDARDTIFRFGYLTRDHHNENIHL
jgi:hypothetical protein